MIALRYQYFVSLLLLAIIFLACEEQTSLELDIADEQLLVVDAIITNQKINQQVKLTLSLSDINANPDPVSNAEVIVEGAGQIYHFIEEIDMPGTYKSERQFAAALNVEYHLEINWDGSIYKASNQMIEVIPFVPLTFKKIKGDSLAIGQVAELFVPNEQAMYEIDIDWTHIVDSVDSKAKLFFYTFNSIDVSELLRPVREEIVFPKNSIVIEKKFSLNPEFASFYRALLLETDWQGGVFDEASSSLPTNITNGGIGFFGVSAVLIDTIIAQ